MVLLAAFQAGQNIFSHGLRASLVLLLQVRDDTITVTNRLVLADLPLTHPAEDRNFYAVVHAHGQLQVRDDPDWVRQQMAALTTQQEKDFLQPWQVEDAPQDFTERLIQQVVGIEIPISRWMGKWKVSQNQPKCNRESVAAHLAQQGGTYSAAIADLVLSRRTSDNKDPVG